MGAAKRLACCGPGMLRGGIGWPGGSAAAAVGPGDDLQQMAVRVLEVQSAAAVPVVDHPRTGLARIGPVRKVLVADPVEGRIEFFVTDEEGVVLGRDLSGGLGEVQGDVVGGLDRAIVKTCGSRSFRRLPAGRLRRVV